VTDVIDFRPAAIMRPRRSVETAPASRVTGLARNDLKGAVMTISTRSLLAPVVAGACLVGFAASSQAATNIVVLNSTSGKITVACNATGSVAPGNGTWSCVDAKIITARGDTYNVKDTHGHSGCQGGAWSIEYINEKTGKVIKNACTKLGFGQIGCQVVQVTETGLRVDVEPNDNACAGQYISQFGGKIFNGLVQVVTKASALIPK
jgi:hypothetical protein